MLYKKYLDKLKECPFCNLKKQEIIFQNKGAILTLAKAPYTKDHLIVFPKKHYLKFNAMTKQEQKNILELVQKGFKKIHKKYQNISVLYREGDMKEIGKSIKHLHIHLIPKMQIGSRNIKWKERGVYSERKYLKEINKLRKDFK